MTVYEYIGGPLDGQRRAWPEAPTTHIVHPGYDAADCPHEDCAFPHCVVRKHVYRKNPLGFLVYEGERSFS